MKLSLTITALPVVNTSVQVGLPLCVCVCECLQMRTTVAASVRHTSKEYSLCVNSRGQPKLKRRITIYRAAEAER